VKWQAIGLLIIIHNPLTLQIPGNDFSYDARATDIPYMP
jgi:hypothetical protein